MRLLRQTLTSPLGWFALQAAAVAALLLLMEFPLAQDAPRLLAIERVRRSLMVSPETSPFAGGLELAAVPYQRPFSVWMDFAEPWAGERLALRLFMTLSTLALAGGLAWMAGGLRLSRRWVLAGLGVPLLLHRSHYMGFLDYNLGLAALPWALGAVLRLRKAGGARRWGCWAILLGSAVAAGLCSPLSAVPFGLAVGVLTLARPRSLKLAAGLLAGAALAPAVAGALMLTSAGEAPKTDFALWPTTIRAILYALDSWDPAGGPAKAPFLLGLLGAIFALAGGRALSRQVEARRGLPLARRSDGWRRSLGGPETQSLLWAGAAVTAFYLAAPSRFSAIDFVTYRMLPAAALCAAFVLPARRGPDLPLLAASATLFLGATIWLHLLANADQKQLALVADEMPRGGWLMILPTPLQKPPLFGYLSPWFDFGPTAALDPATLGGAMPVSLYLPMGHFAIRYRRGAAPIMWQAGAAERWRENDLAAAVAACDAVWFLGLSPEEVRDAAGRRLDKTPLIEGPSWTLWKKQTAPQTPPGRP
jgi:hypothetical protein